MLPEMATEPPNQSWLPDVPERVATWVQSSRVVSQENRKAKPGALGVGEPTITRVPSIATLLPKTDPEGREFGVI